MNPAEIFDRKASGMRRRRLSWFATPESRRPVARGIDVSYGKLSAAAPEALTTRLDWPELS